MPVYDYLCSACRHRTEVIHGIHENGPRFCPACGAEGTMRKGFTTPTFLFKGSGWAKKDRAASARRSSSAKPAASDASSGTSAGSDATGPDGTVASTDDGAGPKSPDRTERSKPASAASNAAAGD